MMKQSTVNKYMGLFLLCAFSWAGVQAKDAETRWDTSAVHEGDVLPAYEQEPSRISSKKPVTFLVFMAADNDLHPFVKGDIDQMQKIGSNANINILVYLNTRYPRQPKVTRKLVVQKGRTVQHGADERRDGGDVRTLMDALQWAHTNFPSDQFVLVLWDHGSGSLNRLLGGRGCATCKIKHKKHKSEEDRAICYDFSTGHVLTDADLRNGLEFARTNLRGGKKIDIVAFDACLMADIEVAFALAPHADYMVASQETIPGTGYGYDKALARVSKQRLSAHDLAKDMVYAYEREYRGRVSDYTLSAIDLGRLDFLTQHVSTLGRILSSMVFGASAKATHAALARATHPRHCINFYFDNNASYFDLGNFCQNLSNEMRNLTIEPSKDKSALLHELDQIRAGLRQYTIANVCGPKHRGACGTSIYFAHRAVDKTYPGLLWSKATWWNHFLEQYVKTGRSVPTA